MRTVTYHHVYIALYRRQSSVVYLVAFAVPILIVGICHVDSSSPFGTFALHLS